MQHHKTIHLSNRLREAIVYNLDVRSVLIDELSDSSEIKSILESYDYLNESRGQVKEYVIAPESIVSNSNGEGSFKVLYHLEFFYACDAITTLHTQEMFLTFKVNFKTGEAIIAGENIPEREPDEL